MNHLSMKIFSEKAKNSYYTQIKKVHLKKTNLFKMLSNHFKYK